MESSVVVKVFRVLEELAEADTGQPLGNVSARIDLPKPTVHRLLKIMIGLGYVQQTGAGLYRLTPKLRQLTPNADRALISAAESVLTDLHEASGETVNLGVLRHDRVMYLRVMESSHPLRRIAEPESTDPFYCTALGRAIVGHLDAAQQEFLLKQPHAFASRTPQTVTDPKQLAQMFAEVKRSGYAIERDQTDVGVTCIGAPVFDSDDQVIAAISLSVPSARAANDGREPELIEMVCHAAQRLSESIGSNQTVLSGSS